MRVLAEAQLRSGAPTTPEGGILADYTGAVSDPGALAAFLDEVPGVTGHGLFGPALVHDVFVGGRDRPLDRPLPQRAEPDVRLTTKLTSLSVPDAVTRLTELLGAKGVTLFDVVDHSAAAAAVGMELRETRVAIFGSPQAGTPVMQAVPEAALDLPLKVLIWRDGEQTKLTYAPPAAIAARYGLGDELAGRLATIDALTDALAD